MKRTFTALAMIGILGAAPAFAQDTVDRENLIRTGDITGGAIYTTNQAYDEGSWGTPGEDYRWGWSGYDSVDSNWNEIGEIRDVVLDTSGQMIGIVAEIGGFLDLGDKHVFLPVEDVDLVAVDDAEYVFITRHSEEELESLDSVDDSWWE